MAAGTEATPPTNNDLLTSVRRTLSEPARYPSGEIRPASSVSFSDEKLIDYCRMVLGEWMVKMPSAFYSCLGYQPHALSDDEWRRASFVLGSGYFKSVTLEVCKHAQLEGTELANPRLAEAQDRSAKDAENA